MREVAFKVRNNMAPKKKLLSIKEKMEIINVFEKEKLSVRGIAKRFNIGKTQAAEINKNKEKIRSKWESGSNVHQKRSFLKEGGSDIDRMCFDWFAKARSQKIPISGPILKAKAMEIAGKLGVPNFNASDGWLNKWRLRNNVSFKCISGEGADVNQDDVEQFRTKLPTLLNGYKPEDIYNADESGLFFRALPDKTLALKSEKMCGRSLVLKHLITKIGDTSSASELSKSINVLEAVYFIKASCHKVEATTIRNCFRKAGFLETLEDPSDFDPEDDIPLAVYARLQEGLDLANDFEGFLQIDQNVFTEDNNIEIQFDEPDDTMDLSDSEDEPSEEISDPITSYDEALKLVERLKQFAKNDYVAFQQVKNIESHFENENFKLKESMLKQTSITQFFQTN
ncbi:tigger transposable element-derived protein 4-like [Rhagoletis pomonella]|uniref:tigger transposable element-derived protein 4-like n=1 Tax=Rhagoletis pomonella TaxID=28610 RepID=UPI00178488C2|nr:tigger transposable element-derived protein 4-like [Rhagoletis pomonella]